MPLDTRQPRCLPVGVNPRTLCEDIAFSGPVLCGFPVLKPEKAYEDEPKSRHFQPPFQAVFPAVNQPLEGRSPCVGELKGIATPQAAFGSSQKRLLIFDQSGNQTRLIHCFAFSPQNPSTAFGKPYSLPDLRDEEEVLKTNHGIPEKVLLHEEFDENNVNGNEAEMHEDTEEINALLYSDEDEDYCDSDDEEVMSTDHSPSPIKDICDKRELEEMLEEVDGPRKRQKLLDGGYDKSSLMDIASSVNPKELDDYHKILDSGLASERETGSGLSNKESRKDKIRTALRILESIVPSAKGKEALLVLDEAIDYLKLLKQTVTQLGVNYC